MNKLATVLITCALFTPAFALESNSTMKSDNAPQVETQKSSVHPIKSLKHWYHKHISKKKTPAKAQGTPNAAYHADNPDAPWVLPS